MEADYYSLTGFSELSEGDLFSIHRTRLLLDAIRNNKDFKTLGKFHLKINTAYISEAIVVDVECHQVPSQNKPGILFRERLAIRILADENKLVEVLALRKSFPTLSHQNYASQNCPANLCLYNLPSSEVFRTGLLKLFFVAFNGG
jgi:hypothetical protein